MTQASQGENNKNKSLGIAGGLAKAFIHSPLSPMLLIACFILGIIGVILTPRQEDPQISVPMVDIFVSYKGATANQVAKLATKPLERIMNEIQGVDHIYCFVERQNTASKSLYLKNGWKIIAENKKRFKMIKQIK